MSIGGIDPGQRRMAQRLVLAALRRFHKEQPLSADLRMDALVTRVRSAADRRPPPRHRGSQPLTLDDAEPRSGTVDFDGLRRPVCLAYTPEAEVGDYVIVHVGFAITLVDEEEAARTLAVLRAMPDAIETELGP